MRGYQHDLGFLLLVKYGTEPFSHDDLNRVRAELLKAEIETHSVTELEWLILSQRLYADRLIEDNIIEFVELNGSKIYRLTKEFIEELRNEK